MSFILDALKKSENERQRTVGPSLADAPLRRVRTDRPWWAVAVAALLIVNLGVLIVVLLRDDKAAEPVAADIPPVASADVPANSPSTARSPQQAPAPLVAPVASAPSSTANPAVRSLADEAGTVADNIDSPANTGLAEASQVPSGPSMVRPVQPPAVAPLNSRATFPAVTEGGNEQRSDEVLPTAGDLAASGKALPELKLDIHVFSKIPAERFVFVNMRKYLEGQKLQEGPEIERITTDGVILNQHGLRFMLPRQ